MGNSIIVFKVKAVADKSMRSLQLASSRNPLDDEILGTYPSVLDASEALRMAPSRISKNLNGGAPVKDRSGALLDFRYLDAWEKYLVWRGQEKAPTRLSD